MTRLRPPATPHDPLSKIWEVATPQLSRIDAYGRERSSEWETVPSSLSWALLCGMIIPVVGVVDPDKKIHFPGRFPPKNRLSMQKFIATSGQIILFLFKSHQFWTYFLSIIRYNNISWLVYDLHDFSATPTTQNLGSRPQSPRIDAHGTFLKSVKRYCSWSNLFPSLPERLLI